MLLRLIYVSRSLSSMPIDMSSILKDSRKNNFLSGINGVLCFLNGVFLQYLEGESTNVTALYEKIKKDSRHQDIKVLRFEKIQQLDYQNWSMALLTWNEETKDIFNSYYPGQKFDVYSTTAASVVSMLAEWRKTPNWMTL